MAGKKTFASKTYASKTFASGTWAGVGAAVIASLPAIYHDLIGPALTSYQAIGPSAVLHGLIGVSTGCEIIGPSAVSFEVVGPSPTYTGIVGP